MANQPISVSKATQMMSEYRSYMTSLGVSINNQTQTVSFDPAILIQWLTDVKPNMDELKVCLCVYPSTDPNAGKITVAFWPYKNGQPATETVKGVQAEIEPFNEGAGTP
jgi:hypothetical protein